MRAVCDRVRAGELSALNLHSSALRPADLAALGRAMAAGVAAAASPQGRDGVLTSIDLSANALGVGGGGGEAGQPVMGHDTTPEDTAALQHVCAMITGFSFLKSLNLADNRIGPNGAALLARALCETAARTRRLTPHA